MGCWMALVKPAREHVLVLLLTWQHQNSALAPVWSKMQAKVSSSLNKVSNTKSEACWREQMLFLNTDTCMSLLHPGSLSSANRLLSKRAPGEALALCHRCHC